MKSMLEIHDKMTERVARTRNSTKGIGNGQCKRYLGIIDFQCVFCYNFTVKAKGVAGKLEGGAVSRR